MSDLQAAWDAAGPQTNDLQSAWDAAQPQPAAEDDSTIFENIRSATGNVLAGGVRGIGGILSNVVAPMQAVWEGTGQTGAQRKREQLIKGLEERLRVLGADPNSVGYGVGKFGAEVAGTAGIPLGTTAKAVPLLRRIAEGAAGGAAGTAMVDPESVGAGAGIGAGLGAISPAVGRFAGGLYDTVRGDLSKLRAAKMAREAAGSSLQRLQGELATAPPNLTAAQAGVDSANDVWVALAKLAERGDPTAYRLIHEQQDFARRGALNQMAMGSSAEGTANAVSQMGRQLERTQGPIREAQLAEANIGRNVPELLRQADELDYQAMMHGGTSAEAARLRQQAQQITDWGYSPIDISGITGRISNVIDDPSLGSSERVASVMRDVAGGLNNWVKRGDGVIDANALYMKRKEAINEAVDKLLAGADPAVTKRLTAKLTAEMKPLIDDAMEASGATGWRRMIDAYSKGFNEMDQVELAGKLRDLYSNKGTRAAFMQAVRGEKPEIIQAVMSSKGGIRDALPASTLDRLTKIADDLSRDIRVDDRTSGASLALSQLVGSQLLGFRLPGFLSRTATISNTALDAIESRINKNTMKIITEAMKSGASANELMRFVPAHERDNVFKWIALGGLSKAAPAIASE